MAEIEIPKTKFSELSKEAQNLFLSFMRKDIDDSGMKKDLVNLAVEKEVTYSVVEQAVINLYDQGLVKMETDDDKVIVKVYEPTTKEYEVCR